VYIPPWAWLTARSHISKRHVRTSRNFLCMLSVAVPRSSSDDSATRYVLPVLWMTSFFDIIGRTQRQSRSLRRSELFTVTRQVAPLNCASGAKSTIADCIITFCVSRMYCGHARLFVCVCVCLCVCPRPYTPTLLHGPGYNLEAW